MPELPINQVVCGNCLQLIDPTWPVDSVVTDPVWPNSKAGLPNQDRAFEVWSQFCTLLPISARRLAVHLGCDTPPDFLSPVPTRLTFFRVCWLEYVRMHYVGRMLVGSDVAYLYGQPPRSIPGQRVIPGRFQDTSAHGKEADHPCPRHLAHVEWLVKWWTEPGDLILDPFCGSGTTCVAAKKLGRQYIGIDISEDYCRIARERLRAVDIGVPVTEARAGQLSLFVREA